MTPYELRKLAKLEQKARIQHVDIIRLWRRRSLMPQDYPGFPFGEAIIDPTFSTETQSSQTTDSTTTQSTQTQSTFTGTTQTVSTASFTTFTPSPDCDDDGVPTIRQSYSLTFSLWRTTRFYISRGYPNCSGFIIPPIVYDCDQTTITATQSRKYTEDLGDGASRLVFEYELDTPNFTIGPIVNLSYVGMGGGDAAVLKLYVPLRPYTSGPSVGLCPTDFFQLRGGFTGYGGGWSTLYWRTGGQSYLVFSGSGINCGLHPILSPSCEVDVTGRSYDPSGYLSTLIGNSVGVGPVKPPNCFDFDSTSRYDLCSGELLPVYPGTDIPWQYSSSIIRVSIA